MMRLRMLLKYSQVGGLGFVFNGLDVFCCVLFLLIAYVLYGSKDAERLGFTFFALNVFRMVDLYI